MREKVIMMVLIIGAWMAGTANAGGPEVVSSFRTESGTESVRTVSEELDVVLNQWPVWNRQKVSEKLVQEYLDNTLPGVYFSDVADMLTIHVYLTRRARKRRRIFCTAVWKK